MCFTWLAENTGLKKSPKIRHLGTITQICRAVSLQLWHVRNFRRRRDLYSVWWPSRWASAHMLVLEYFTVYSTMHCGASCGIAMVILPVRDQWLNRLMFYEHNITTNYPRDLDHCSTLFIYRGIFTKAVVSLKRSSLEPKLLHSGYRNWCAAYRLVTNLMT